MTDLDATKDLHHYLQGARETLVWKVDGLDEYDVRRPLTPTGTNLLGLVKHNAATHLRYFGDVFGRPADPSLAWLMGGRDPTASSGLHLTRAGRRSWTATGGLDNLRTADPAGRSDLHDRVEAAARLAGDS